MMKDINWNLSNPILIIYTTMNLLELPDLQFKLLLDNGIKIPELLQNSLFGKQLSSYSLKTNSKSF